MKAIKKETNEKGNRRISKRLLELEEITKQNIGI